MADEQTHHALERLEKAVIIWPGNRSTIQIMRLSSAV